MKKKVAAVVTEYRKWSHADVIVGKVLEGFTYDGGAGPAMQVVSMYVDQFSAADMSRALAKKHRFTIYDTIEKALTLGGDQLAVDGVLCIGEHGKYPTNARGQILYPRRRFFEAVTKVFERSKRSVPVFNDKHLAATWQDAKWMYDRARALFVPFLAGSSLPVTWRQPPLKLERGCDLIEGLQIGYGPFEGYGFHALEGLQCMAERRKGGETGVKAVQCLQGTAMWKALDEGRWSKKLLEAALKLVSAHAKGDVRALTSKTNDAGVFLIEYRDGFKGAVALLNGWLYEGDGGDFIFAGQLKGQEKPVATEFTMQQPDPFGHFIGLVKAIDSMMQTGHPPYPVERTLLTTGVLDALMVSMSEKNRVVETKHLDIRYKPTDWPFATDPVPKPIKR
ncbi:MAG: hypothetical protein HYS12_04330 [Planctomycetes bacterium]|nr:hypothetical protein [Planctomycetota bacterium]